MGSFCTLLCCVDSQHLSTHTHHVFWEPLPWQQPALSEMLGTQAPSRSTVDVPGELGAGEARQGLQKLGSGQRTFGEEEARQLTPATCGPRPWLDSRRDRGPLFRAGSW